MIREFLAFLEFDVWTNRKYFLFAAVLSIGYAFASNRTFSSGETGAVFVLCCTLVFLMPTLVPWWTIGNDRTKGTIRLLVGLPLSRQRLASIKAMEAFVISTVVGICVGVVLVAGGRLQWEIAIVLIGAFLPLTFAAATLTTAAFLVLPPRVALYVVLPLFVGFFETAGKRLILHSGTFDQAVILLDISAVAIGCAALALGTYVWSRRPSPAD